MKQEEQKKANLVFRKTKVAENNWALEEKKMPFKDIDIQTNS